ncbi:MAG: orotate phosphoribosyltransferase [Methanolobus sp.]|nr:orotate phosphoribosyltransferase [Methanolobus sp.]
MSHGNGKRTLIDALKACGAVKFGDFTLASGKKSSYYIDIKKASTDPKTLKIIAKEAGKVIKDMNLDAVGGVVLGGVPLATAVSMETDLPLILIIVAIREAGAVVDSVITVVDRESGAEKSLSDIGVKLVPLVRASDLI